MHRSKKSLIRRVLEAVRGGAPSNVVSGIKSEGYHRGSGTNGVSGAFGGKYRAKNHRRPYLRQLIKSKSKLI